MKLISYDYSINIELQENRAFILSVEDSNLFSSICNAIWDGIHAASSSILCYEGEKEINLEKYGDIIFNPFSLDINSKRMNTRLFQELKEISLLYNPEQFLRLRQQCEVYLAELSGFLPYNISYNSMIDEQSFYKMFNVVLDSDCCTSCEKLIEYITVSQQLLGIRVLFFVNLKDYFDDVQITEIYKAAFYCKVYLVVLERKKSQSLSCETGLIIDKDLCQIIY